MRQTFRKNTFETNSSSIHCLTVRKEDDYDADDPFFMQELDIYPYNQDEGDALESIISEPIDKLRYLWTIRCRGYIGGVRDNYISQFTGLLKSIFPNVRFHESDDPAYLEDYEYIFDDDKLYSEKFIKKLFSDPQASIIFTTRDFGYYDWKSQTWLEGLREREHNTKLDVIWSEG